MWANWIVATICMSLLLAIVPIANTQDGTYDPYGDDDGDSIPNEDELLYGTSPTEVDTDGDGLDDDVEIYGFDIVFTIEEDDGFGGTYTYDVSEFIVTDPTKADTDDDLMPDLFEIENGYHPLDPSDGNSDWDGDELTLGQERFVYFTYWGMWDSDLDGFSDGEEVDANTDPMDILSFPSDTSGTGSGGDGTNQGGDGTGTGDDDGSGTDGGGDDTSNTPEDDVWFDGDGDGLPDVWEEILGLDPNDPTDASADFDNDGLEDWAESLIGTDYSDWDSDDDNLSDADEWFGLERIVETDDIDLDTGLPIQESVWFLTDPLLADTDQDGLNDDEEFLGVEVTVMTVDESGMPIEEQVTFLTDPELPDTDGDLLPDGFEINIAYDPTDRTDGDQDLDSDGLTNGEEYLANTLWEDDDTDDGGALDGAEVAAGTNPVNNPDDDLVITNQEGDNGGAGDSTGGTTVETTDSDGDGVDDGTETQNGTDPDDDSSTVPQGRCAQTS